MKLTPLQAVDKDGNVISEEVTTQENLNNAYEAAKGLAPDGGDVRLTTVEKALEERKARFDQEQGPVVRDMLDDESMDTLQEMLDSGELAEAGNPYVSSKADPNHISRTPTKLVRNTLTSSAPQTLLIPNDASARLLSARQYSSSALTQIASYH